MLALSLLLLLQAASPDAGSREVLLRRELARVALAQAVQRGAGEDAGDKAAGHGPPHCHETGRAVS